MFDDNGESDHLPQLRAKKEIFQRNHKGFSNQRNCTAICRNSARGGKV